MNYRRKLYYSIATLAGLYTPIILGTSSVSATSHPDTVHEKETINKIVAVVNQEIITQNELRDAIQQAEAHYAKKQLPSPDSATLEKNALQNLIYQKLQLDLAKQNHISVSPEQVSHTIAQIAEENHISVAVLQNKLLEQGIAFDQFQEQINEQLMLLNLQQKALAGKITMADEEIQQWAQKNNLSIAEAKQMLYQEKFQTALKSWLNTLESSAYVKVYADNR